MLFFFLNELSCQRQSFICMCTEVLEVYGTAHLQVILLL